MKPFDIATIEKFTGRPGFIGTFVHSEKATVAHWEIAKGTELAFHSHPHEQITLLLSGKLELGAGDEEKVMLPPGRGSFSPGVKATEDLPTRIASSSTYSAPCGRISKQREIEHREHIKER